MLVWLGALAIGLSLGLLGSGGSIFTVPALLYLAHQDEKVAIASSLGIVAGISLFASLPYARRGEVDWRSVIRFGLPGIVGTFGGAWLAKYVSAHTQLALLGLVMLVASVLMLRKPVETARTRPHPTWMIALEGLAVGVLTGLVGVGGGFLIVPALVLLGGLPMRRAIGTSLVIITLKSLVGFAKYVEVLGDLDLAVDWNVLALFTAVGIAGSLLGSRVSSLVPQRALQRVFAAVLVLAGAGILLTRWN
ncbi:MAG: sulfite exporter TauE/SafE family protein [Planctomycetaceae bacterium]|nr:sulfite exporter TauE/SafE family protein [Planctomycetaceae bacterium]